MSMSDTKPTGEPATKKNTETATEPTIPHYVVRFQTEWARFLQRHKDIAPRDLVESLRRDPHFLADIIADDRTQHERWERKKSGIFPNYTTVDAVHAELSEYRGYLPFACFIGSDGRQNFQLSHPIDVVRRKYAARRRQDREACVCHYFEHGMPVKFHMDIDGKGLVAGYKDRARATNKQVWDLDHRSDIDAAHARFQCVVQSIVAKAKRALAAVGLPRAVFAVHTCKGWKPSCHVVAIQYAWAHTLRAWKAFVDRELWPNLDETERSVFDASIYAKSRAFRMNGMCKFGDWQRPLHNEPDPALSDDAAVEMYNTHCIEFEWRSFPALIMYDEIDARLAGTAPPRAPRRRTAAPRAAAVGLPRAVQVEIVRRVQAVQPDIDTRPASVTSSHAKANVVRIEFSRMFTAPCPFGEHHTSNCVLVELHAPTGDLVMSCFGGACASKKRALERLPRELCAQLRAVPRDLAEPPPSEMIDGIETITYEAQRCAPVRPVFFRRKTVLLRAAMSTGKTFQMSKQVQQVVQWHKDDARVLVVLPRRDLCKAILARFNKDLARFPQRFRLYLDDRDQTLPRETLSGINLLVIQMDSLAKLPHGYGAQPWHLGVVDESESNARHFQSKTMDKKRRLVYNHMEAHFHPRACERLFMCDAHLGERSVHLAIECWQRPQVVKMVNEFRADDKTWTYYKKKEKWFARLASCLRAGKHVFLPSNCSIAEMEATKTLLRQELPGVLNDETHLVIHSKASRAARDTMKNPNEAWRGLRLLQLSPSGAMGVDFTVQHFDVVFAHFVTSSSTACGAHQTTGRVRNVGDREVHVHIASPRSNDLRPETAEAIQQHRKIVDGVTWSIVHELWDPDAKGFAPSPQGYSRLLELNIIEENRSRNDFLGELRGLVEQDGGHWRACTRPPPADPNAGHTHAEKKRLQHEALQRIVDADVVTREEFDRLRGLRARGLCSELDQAKIDKFCARAQYPRAELTREFVREWCVDPQGDRAFRNFRRAVGCEKRQVGREYELLCELTKRNDFEENIPRPATVSRRINEALYHYGFDDVHRTREGEMVVLMAPVLSRKEVSQLDLQRRLDTNTATRGWFTANGGSNPTFLANEVKFENPIAKGTVPTAVGFCRFVRNLLRKAFADRLNLKRARKHRVGKKDRVPRGWPPSRKVNDVHVINPEHRRALLKVYRASRYWDDCDHAKQYKQEPDWRDRALSLLQETASHAVDDRQRSRKRKRGAR